MAVDEIAIWEQMGTAQPQQVVSLHDVPLSALYGRPR